MASGQLILQQITDEQFRKLLEIKDKNPSKISIPSNQPITPTTVGTKTGFSNIYLAFNDAEGLKLAADILEMLAT